MAFKVFLDANVCIDFLFQRKGFEPSERIFEKVISGELKAYTSPAIIHIISYFLKKVLDKDTVRNLVLNLFENVTVIDCTHEIAVHAVNSQMTDIEDALQYYTAMHHKMNYFISLDKNLLKSAIPVLPAYTPTEFLNEIKQ
ncbi:MAG: putative toxin-antitoxin system toxin component, PIN family [Sphingobacteriaceae bacterium]|nr:putative toxin-antitoxin system toxin component, PIN family [Sphingobacteriaceae bacterium]